LPLRGVPLMRAMHVGAGCALALAIALAGHAQAPAPAPTHNKRCDAANKRVAREQKDVAATLEALGRERKARESCTSRSVCARFDDNIATIEKRHQRHEVRLVRSRGEVLEACRPPASP
jgi:hypothetical protein